MNHGRRLKILLIEDNPGDALLISKMLSTARDEFDFVNAETLADGLDLLGKAAFDLLLLDLGLPDSVGLETLDCAFSRFPHIPIIVFTGLADEETGFEAVHRGAQDYLIKADVDTRQLMRSIRYSMERKRADTEKEALEDQLRHSQKMEAVGTLAGGIAHDFNNMLNVIMGYGELMRMRLKEDDPGHSYLQEILKAGERAAQLTRGLLAFSRKQVLSMRPENVNAIIEGFRKMLSRIIGEDINLRISLSDDDTTVMADSSQIEQVLMNLAANARDAMPHGGALTIKTETAFIDRAFVHAHGYGKPGRYALVTISDTGVGMDQITLARIFEPYFTTKEMGRGTGLGLSIVYGIVSQHNGYIYCSSEAGKGTTFSVFLPLAISKAKSGDSAIQTAPVGGTETILLAEDDPGVRQLASETLSRYGYKVVEAVDGNEAVRKFLEHSGEIKLLLFDMIMPNKDGREAYEEIKAMRHDVKAVFMSGYATDIIQKRGALEDGMELLSKPVSLHTLLKKVRAVLDD
ncbi:MAG: response regulator [Nitrospirae bacterium]|nr:response regulator [Nitrospirota bacterium]